VGGSIGISIVNTIVARHEQLHRSELAHSLAATNPLFENRVSTLQGLVAQTNATGPVLAHNSAMTLLNNTVSAQARLLSYIDDFRYMALVCFGCLPLVLLFQRARPRRGAVHAE
jgi:DHA2 family multidrug resistance protein